MNTVNKNNGRNNKMNKITNFFIAAVCIIIAICFINGCGESDTKTKKDSETYTGKYSGDTISYSTFTNRYGTESTVCAHPGCTNYIAESGDTNCCTSHSARCLQCGCYIDEDAVFCMQCLEEALK